MSDPLTITFLISHAVVTQDVHIVDKRYDGDSIIAGLQNGTLATTTWFEGENKSCIDEVATGIPVAIILAQEIDGEYENFDYGEVW